MLKKYIFTLSSFSFIFWSQCLSAQIKGVVVDTDGQAIPYATIQSGTKGTNAELDGTFSLEVGMESVLQVSSVGFETRSVPATQASRIVLDKITYGLQEVVVVQPKGRESIETDKIKGATRYHNSEMTARFFPNNAQAQSHPFLKSLTLRADSDIDGAKVKLMLKAVNADGSPGADLLAETAVFSVKKGNRRTVADLSRYHVSMPDNGIFVVVEPLRIESNAVTRDIELTLPSGELRKIRSKTYQPQFGYLPSEENRSWYFRNQKWVQAPREKLENPKSWENLLMRKYHDKFVDIAMSLTLTN